MEMNKLSIPTPTAVRLGGNLNQRCCELKELGRNSTSIEIYGTHQVMRFSAKRGRVSRIRIDF